MSEGRDSSKDVHVVTPAPPGPTFDPWQVTVGKYLVDHLPTIIAAIGLAVGGCYAESRIKQGQEQTHEKLDQHQDELKALKKAVDAKETGK